MKWSDALLSIVVLFGIIFIVVLCAEAAAESPSLTVEGIGTVTVPADTASISISVTSSNDNMTTAQAEASRKMSNVIDALKAIGVKDDEIMSGQSTGVTSYQSTSKVCKVVNNTTVCENSTFEASSLERSAVVRLRTVDQSRINEVVEAAKSAGAKAYLAGYGLGDASKAVADARQKAVANAKENAQQMASAAGVRLGKVLEISAYGLPDINMAGSYSSGQTGMVDVTSYVIVTYEIVT
ncbi:MAG: oxidative stress defense protein [Methanosaeta sp. PtaB.Bin018]|jgi:hypothetical protein|nr:MAG: oxidative stress defense protein [Methanosaeta sp. PtaB.Bin018]